jgi:hypothetical protein
MVREGVQTIGSTWGKEARKASPICFNSSSMEGSLGAVRPKIFPLTFSFNRVKVVDVCEEYPSFIGDDPEAVESKAKNSDGIE